VINFLDEQGVLDRTVIVIVGDHGESLGEHGEASHGLFVYESVIRIPLIIRAPSAGMQGRQIVDPVRIVDVTPTVLDLLGETPAPATDGQTLVPLMNGAVKELKLEAYSESRYGFDRFGWSPVMALRQGRFKLIRAPRPELYDLASDPRELLNLYGQRGGLAATLMERLQRIGEPADTGRVADIPAVDSDTRARLAALGYVNGFSSRSARDPERLADPKDRIELYRRFTEQPQRPGEIP
jgi:arylsulfatase A-like enzyme